MQQSVDPPKRGWGALEPLREPVFRRIWSASLLANFGQLILGVGAAWEMAQLTSSTDMVALVQTALMLPLMLIAVPAGAIADMFDRRKVAMGGLAFATVFAMLLAVFSFAGFTSPWMLLGFCSLIGIGVAIYMPAWQASTREQVSAAHLPAAVAMGSISYNVARSFGPAIGGVIVLLAGAKAAFAVNAFCYLPMLLAFLLWRRLPTPSRLAPERIDRAIISGARYAIHSIAIRIVLIRSLTFGFAGSSIVALTPIVARDLLHGNAGTYGLLLGLYGVGAVFGALTTGQVRERIKAEHAVRMCAIVNGLMIVAVGLSRNIVLTAAAMMMAGAAWMLLVSLLNVGVQLSAPRWVTARALSWFQAALTGGIAMGAWMWGSVAQTLGAGEALVISGCLFGALPVLGLILPMPRVSLEGTEPAEMRSEPEVGLALTARSGPIAIEVDYRVDPEQARTFYGVMLQLQRSRKRNGAFDWSISRDIRDPELWTERYHCPTWGDYLHLRSRSTQLDRDLQDQADGFDMSGEGPRIRRRLERPFGSVRWRAETPDTHTDTIAIYTP